MVRCTNRGKVCLTVALILSLVITASLWGSFSFLDHGTSFYKRPATIPALLEPMADSTSTAGTGGKVTVLIHDETIIDRFWGKGYGQKWEHDAQATQYFCPLSNRCSVQLVNRSRRNHVPPISTVKNTDRAITLLAVGEASKVNSRDLDRAYDFARKKFTKPSGASAGPAVAVLLTEGDLGQARASARTWRHGRWGGRAQLYNAYYYPALWPLSQPPGPRLRGHLNAYQERINATYEPTSNIVLPNKRLKPPGPALVELSADRRAGLWLPPACPAWRLMRDELRRRFGPRLAGTTVVLSLPEPKRSRPDHQAVSSPFGVYSTPSVARPSAPPSTRPSPPPYSPTTDPPTTDPSSMLHVASIRHCKQGVLYWRAVRAWIVAMVREHWTRGSKGLTSGSADDSIARDERDTFLRCARRMGPEDAGIQAPVPGQFPASLFHDADGRLSQPSSNPDASTPDRGNVTALAASLLASQPGLPWRLGACAVASAVSSCQIRKDADAAYARSKDAKGCTEVSYSLQSVVQFISEYINTPMPEPGSVYEESARYLPFRPQLRPVRSLSMVSNCSQDHEAVLAGLGPPPASMVHLGSCPQDQGTRARQGGGDWHGSVKRSSPFAAGPLAGRGSDGSWETKLAMGKQSRYLFAFEAMPAGYGSWNASGGRLQSMHRMREAVWEAERSGYVSEKVLDAVAAGAVPIFHGAPDAASSMLPAGVHELGEVWWQGGETGHVDGARGSDGEGYSGEGDRGHPWSGEGRLKNLTARIASAGPLEQEQGLKQAGIVSGQVSSGRVDPAGTAGWNASSAGLFLSRYAGWRLGHMESGAEGKGRIGRMEAGEDGQAGRQEPEKDGWVGTADELLLQRAFPQYIPMQTWGYLMCKSLKATRRIETRAEMVSCYSAMRSLLVAEGEWAVYGPSLLGQGRGRVQSDFGVPWLGPLLLEVESAGICRLAGLDPGREARRYVARACSASKWCRLCGLMAGS